MFAFGLPLVPSALGLWALSYLDGWLLRVLADLDAVGIYSFASELCLPLGLLLTSIHLAWPSFSFARVKREGGAAEVARSFRHLFVVLTGGGLAIAVLRHEALVVLSADTFQASAAVIPLLALATVIYGAARAFETGLQVAGDTRRLPLLVTLAAAVNAGLNVLLIPTFRETGAAVATVVTNLVLGAVVLRESNRQYRVPFEIGRLVRILAGAALVLLAADALPALPFAAGLGLRLVLLALFPVVLVPLGALSRSELRGLPAIGREIIGRRA
jgi:O-antigen/teichoic acid export membrane protein